MPFKDPEKKRAHSRAYDAANRDKRRVTDHARYLANREKVLERNKKYRESHPEQIKEYKERRIIVCGMYIASVGMTRKQREKFQKELNDGKTK